MVQAIDTQPEGKKEDDKEEKVLPICHFSQKARKYDALFPYLLLPSHLISGLGA
jgi:uncharacterized protein (DUF169 family)